MRILILLFGLWSASFVQADGPIILDPSVTATPPGVSISAAYFTMINEGKETITVTEAFSPSISKVEIHKSMMKDDVASMEKQASVSVKPGETLKFEHGSYHLMLMNLTEPLKIGDVIDVVLTTSIGDFLIEMPVIKLGTTSAHSDDHGDEKSPMKHDAMKDQKDDDHEGMKDETHEGMKADAPEDMKDKVIEAVKEEAKTHTGTTLDVK